MNKLIIFNAESSYFYFKDMNFRKSLAGSYKMYCDSFSLSLMLKICKIPHRRLHGPDFMDNILRFNANNKIIILGGSQVAHKRLKEKYHLNRTKFYSRKINKFKINRLFNEIEEFSPNIIFVCLGLRKQELIADIIWSNFKKNNRLNNTIIVGVGAAVDFLGETKIRASLIWRKFGLEWLPRVFREPRMIPRIIRAFFGCILFLFNYKLLAKDKLQFAENLYSKDLKKFLKT